MVRKNKLFIAAIIAVILLSAIFINGKSISEYIRYWFYSKNDLVISLALANPTIRSLTSEPSNTLALQVQVVDKWGFPVPKAHVKFLSSENIGEFYSSGARTDSSGRLLAAYIPPSYNYAEFKGKDKNVTITAKIYNSKASANISIALTRVPVIFIHGYQSTSSIFDNMREYLSLNGFQGGALNYNSQKGVISAAAELTGFLKQQKLNFLLKGIQVGKFDIVAHSMGGLVARYYTCSTTYLSGPDVRKIIFVSTPHKGSHWASIGINYFNTQGMKDLIPDSSLIVNTFPSMLNKGLNSSIQVGNILGQYDEVVSAESASLDEWNIKTEIFDIGGKSLTMDNILTGKIVEAPNHQSILDNKKVFEKIENMLNSELPYPSIKK